MSNGKYRYLHLDVFTDRPLMGNQLAVFMDAEDLDADVMQRIALEMAFSETTFVFPAEHPGTDYRVRIFTPRAELPMAGHPMDDAADTQIWPQAGRCARYCGGARRSRSGHP
jgi:PhzF family phenazine biosynthesis protein